MRAWPLLIVLCLMLAGCQRADESNAPDARDSADGESGGSISKKISVRENGSANTSGNVSGNKTAPPTSS